MKQLRIGTIGSGMIAHEIINAIRCCEGAVCKAVYSRNQLTAVNLSAEHCIPVYYTDLDAMLKDPELNCIYIASPNSLHYEHARRALECGKHVILEKPFCSTLQEAEALMAMAQEKDLMIMEAVTTGFLPNYPILKELLPKIGRIRLVQCSYIQYSARYEKLLAGQVPNVFNPEFSGGCLQDLNYYNIHFLISLWGRPVSAEYHPNLYPGLADTSGVMIMQYPDFICQCTGAKDCHGESSVLICGENGSISIPDSCNSMGSICTDIAGEKSLYTAQNHTNRWIYEMQNLVPLFLAEDSDTIRHHNRITLETVKTIEAARKAAGILFPADRK